MIRQLVDGSDDHQEGLVMIGNIAKGNTSSSTSRCQDCGNQAKKECVYLRCRTCCKSKGFHCQTHVKSTWVPLYRRRQRQLILQQQTQHFHSHHQERLVQHNQSSSQGLEDQDGQNDSDRTKFPVEVNATASFRVVRVSSMADDGSASQLAYQTSVVIGGHVFKGMLYDQGPETSSTSSYCGLVAGDQSSDHPPGLVFHQLPSSFVNNDDNDNSNSVNDPISATTLITSRDYVVANQRPLFIGSASSSSIFLPNSTANFMSAGMQFFPNRE